MPCRRKHASTNQTFWKVQISADLLKMEPASGHQRCRWCRRMLEKCLCYNKLSYQQPLNTLNTSEFVERIRVPGAFHIHWILRCWNLRSQFQHGSLFLFLIPLFPRQEMENCTIQSHNEGLWGQETGAVKGSDVRLVQYISLRGLAECLSCLLFAQL